MINEKIKKILAMMLLFVILMSMTGCKKNSDEAKEVIINYDDSVLEYKFDEDNTTASVSGLKESVTSEEEDDLKEIIIPNIVTKDNKNYRVTSMKRNSYSSIFADLKNLTSISIPASCNLPEGAFKYCNSLEKVTIQYGLEKIPENAFYECKNLVEVNIPDSITEIGKWAFYECEKLEKIIFPNSIVKMSSGVLYHCDNLKEVKLPDGLSTVPPLTFYSCKNLKSVDLPNNITRIGESAFSSCTNLTDIALKDNITEIDNEAFKGCTSLENINLPDSLTEIGAYAFEGCTKLSTITIPENVKTIETYAFGECKDLTINVKGKAELPDDGWSLSWNSLGSTIGGKIKTNWDETVEKTNTSSETKTFSEKKVDKLSDVSWQYDKIDFSNLKWLNTERYGNICIPNNWEKDEDVAMITDSVITYGLSDASQTITINDCSSSAANSEIQNLLTKLSADAQLEEWSNETIKIGDKNAVVVNAKFKGINHIQSTMFIASEDESRMIIVCVEASDPDVGKLLNTFTFEKVDADANSFFESSTK